MDKRSISTYLAFLLILRILLLCTPAVVHAQWEPDVRLTFDADSSLLSSNNAHCLAASGDTLHVVWHDLRSGNWKIYYKRSTDAGTSWSPDTSLSAGTDSSTNPSIAVSGSNVHLVWQDHQDGNWEIYYKRSLDGGTTWESEYRLTTDTMLCRNPSMAVSDSVLCVLWSSILGDSAKIFFKRSTNNGLSWLPDTCLKSLWLGNSLVSVSSGGPAVYTVFEGVSIDPLGDLWNLHYQRSSDMGQSWLADTIVEHGGRVARSGWAYHHPSIAVLNLNVHYVCGYIWHNFLIHGTMIKFRKSSDGGISWFSSIILANMYNASSPVIAVSGSNVHVCWSTNYDLDSNYDIYYINSLDGGSNWNPETLLINDSASANSPFIAVQGSKVHVVWTDNRDGNYEIYYKHNLTGNGVAQNEHPSSVSRLPFSVQPNPFASLATVPGHEAEHFALYDIAGRKVGTYKGDRIGFDLNSGVYFICGLSEKSNNSNPVRIVKIK